MHFEFISLNGKEGRLGCPNQIKHPTKRFNMNSELKRKPLMHVERPLVPIHC